MSEQTDFISAESQRIQTEYQRRAQEMQGDIYAPWQPSTILGVGERQRVAATLLHLANAFPKEGAKCLEVGYGALGWLGELISWGVHETDIHGIELNPDRALRAQERLPAADLRVGDATQMPWESNRFDLVVVSTVFTSILDNEVRRLVANEITRVLAPGGVLLWYDFAVDNPRNPNVRKVTRKELGQLFPKLGGRVQSVTLAPPLARRVAPRSWLLATLLQSIPMLRTHLIAVLAKQA